MWCIPKGAAKHRRGAAVMLLVAAVTVSGCGLKPLYSRQAGGAPENLSAISVERIPDRVGQKLHNLLLDRLNPKGPAAKTRYVLTVKVNESQQNLGVQKDAFATRANLTLSANFTLALTGDSGRDAFHGVASSTNSYNILRSEFATLNARNDARDRALREIADEIRSRVAVALGSPDAFAVSRPMRRK